VGFALPVFVAMLWQKQLISQFLGMVISVTDYMPVLEFGFSLTLGFIIYHVLKRNKIVSEIKQSNGHLHVLETIMLTAVSVHLANYLYSGIQKIIISDPWWLWGAENPTYNLTLAALAVGAAPVSLFGHESIKTLLDTQVRFNMPLNYLLLFLQLSAVIAITRIRWAAFVTLMYDVTHIIIFIATGIFFYKWIWLNLLITVSLSTMKHKKISREIILLLICVMIFSPFVYFVAFLGWFDTPSFNDEFIEAVSDNGDVYRVPSNYFLSGSITFAQQRVLRNKPGHFPTNTYGSWQNKMNKTELSKIKSCQLPNVEVSAFGSVPQRQHVSSLLRYHHKYILSHIDGNGIINYDIYPHHIFSMPWSYRKFHDLDKKTITSYRYVVESKCLSYKDGVRSSKKLLRGEFDVPLK
jgi:hypothetical protein